MNYKVMQRPMFRLGGSARKNYQNGTELQEITDLINKRADIRNKSLSSMSTMLPFQVLAGQGNDIRTIRSLGDVTNILSNLGTDPNTFAALGKLNAIDLKKTEGELSDKITLAKLKQSTNKKFEFEKRLQIAETIEQTQKNLLSGKSEAEQKIIRDSDQYKNLEKRKSSILREMSETEYLFQRSIKDGQYFDIDEARKDFRKISGSLADGGRVGYQDGTPNPNMVMPQPKPKEVMDDRKLDTLMTAAPALESPGEVKQMAMKDEDMYAALRRRLPPEITDDVVRLIAYNQEAFADFANISDQSDVESFNKKYNVELVLPVGNQ